MNLIYIIGLALIPFDNLFFAPSYGWATISPMIFFLYNLLNLKKSLYILIKKEKFILGIIYLLLTYSMFIFLIYPPNIGNAIDTLQTIVLGLSFYIALINRYIIDKNNFEKDIKILLKSYHVSFIYGCIKYLALNFSIMPILSLFELIEKRTYARLAFSFSEPSFIGLHLFGILLPLYYFIKDKNIKKDIIRIIILFTTLTILSKSTTRFIIDITVVLTIYIIYILFSKHVKVLYKLLTIFILTSVFTIGILTDFNFIKSNDRIQSIVTDGIYADSSLASRYFRVNASIKGYQRYPIKSLFGTGIGNAYMFLEDGYDEAFKEYKNAYTYEVENLKYSKDGQLFSMPIRLISEFGIIVTIIIFTIIIKNSIKNKNDIPILLVVLYLYIQFDSYAFYSFWIYLFYIKYKTSIIDIKLSTDLI